MGIDLVIRNGMVVDGSGGEPYVADVAVTDGKIVNIGSIAQRGARELDATGLVVTPGFVDVHTHYDGQAIWGQRMLPSSNHGVTTVVMGNCGVGFAPCRQADHDLLVNVMAGVEDIPGAVMAEGLPWTWETFPQYLDALDARERDIDVAAYLPHSPLRVYVMGERGANHEPATDDDLNAMRALAAEAVQAGAIGFATSRLMIHRTVSGDTIPSYNVDQAELQAIAEGVREGGGGLLQAVPDIPMDGRYEPILKPLIEVAASTGQPLTFTLATGNMGPGIWREAVSLVENANASGGRVTAQVFPRPIGLIEGLELSVNPFMNCPTYQAMAELPLAERVAKLRDPAVKANILSEPGETDHPFSAMIRAWNDIYPLGEDPDYEPVPEHSIAARAAARGVTPEEEAYDQLLALDGRAMLFVALGNYENGRLDSVGELLKRDDVVAGLGDGGAHYGMLCDGSYPTTLLAHWARDRKGERLSLPQAIKALTSEPAQLAGLLDRGRLAVGYKADINLIDHARMRMHKPRILHDLPAGGRRLDQTADGYVATIVSGQVIVENGQPTNALPGKLVRGRQAAPSALDAASV